jgi:hypothetical protein
MSRAPLGKGAVHSRPFFPLAAPCSPSLICEHYFEVTSNQSERNIRSDKQPVRAQLRHNLGQKDNACAC